MKNLLWVLFPFILVFSPLAAQENAGLDARLFQSINARQDPDRSGFFEYLDESSVPTFAAFPLGLAVIGAGLKDRAVLETGILSAGAQLTSLVITVGLKEIIGRPRPFEALRDVKVKHQSSATGSSFPSGHTSQAFAVATVVSLRFPQASVMVPAIVWATCIGYGRMYLGLHYPLDVLGGIVVGVLSGFAAWSLRSNAEKLAAQAITEQRIGQAGLPMGEIVKLRIPLSF